MLNSIGIWAIYCKKEVGRHYTKGVSAAPKCQLSWEDEKNEETTVNIAFSLKNRVRAHNCISEWHEQLKSASDHSHLQTLAHGPDTGLFAPSIQRSSLTVPLR